MFSHVTVGSADLRRATRFYDALLSPLGLVRRPKGAPGGPANECWNIPGTRTSLFFVTEPFDRRPAEPGNGAMTAFLAASPAAVDAAHAAGLQAGGTDEGAPGRRPHYGTGYYGAYLRDPDGNKVHVVHRGDIEAGG